MTLADGAKHAFPHARVLVTDVDGTLLDSSGGLTQTCVSAVEEFKRYGGGIILATGKLYHAIEGLVAQLRLELPQIVCDGGAIAYPDTGAIVPVAPMSANDVGGICSLLCRHKTEYVLYGTTEVVAGREGVGKENTAKLERIGEPEIRGVDRTECVHPQNPVLKILSFVEPGRMEKDLIASVRDQFPTLRSTRTSRHFLEFSSSDSGKLAALERISNICGFNLSEVAAVGDNDNDVEIISRAGLGGAVASASEKAKAAANILVPSNDENGFAVFVERVLGNCS